MTMMDALCSLFGGDRTTMWFLLALFAVLTTPIIASTAIVGSAQYLSLKSDVIDEMLIGEPSSCKCRMSCMVSPNCTAVTLRSDADTGMFDCFFSNYTDLTEDDFEFEPSSSTWQRITVDTSKSNESLSITEIPVAAANTTNIAAGTTTTSNTTATIPTSTTTTTVTTADTNSCSGDCFAVGAEETFDKATMKCWEVNAVLYAAESRDVFDEDRALLPDLISEGTDELWVGIVESQWTNGMDFTRQAEDKEWIAGSEPPSDKPCAYSKRGDDFLLEPEVCDGTRRSLCKVQDCMDAAEIPISSEVIMMCKKTDWENADQLCKDNGGRLYFSTSNTNFKSMASYMQNKPRIFFHDMWVGVKDGQWTTGDDVTFIWAEVGDSKNGCASVEKENGFFLKSHDCNGQKEVLCKKISCPDDHIQIPEVGCVKAGSSKSWLENGDVCDDELGLKLYSPKTDEEFEALMQYLNDNPDSPLHQDMWVSVSYKMLTKSYEWGSGSDIKSTFWDVNDQKSVAKLCGYINKLSGFKLTADFCLSRRTMLCKIVEP